MALDETGLADALTAVFDGRDGFPESAAAAGRAWAGCYRGYAGKAQAGPSIPVPAALDAAGKALADRLAGVFDTVRTGGSLAAGLDEAFTGFWPPVGFASAGVAGVVTLAPPGVLGTALAATFAAAVASGGTARAQAGAVAGVLHSWTRTVVVVNTPPGPWAPVFLN
jgi:hypothetical protein